MSCVQWRVEMCSSSCSEQVNLRVYLESVKPKYGVANYHTHLTYTLEQPMGLCLVSKKKKKKKKKKDISIFQYVFDFAMGPLVFKLF